MPRRAPKRRKVPRETAEQANRRIAESSLRFALDRCEAWAAGALVDETAPPELRHVSGVLRYLDENRVADAELMHAALTYRENLRGVLDFLSRGNTSAALASASMLLANLVGMMEKTAQGVASEVGRLQGANKTAAKKLELHGKRAAAMEEIRREAPTRFRTLNARAVELERRIKAGGYPELRTTTAAAIMKRVQRDRQRDREARRKERERETRKAKSGGHR